MANGFIDGIGYPMNGGLSAGLSIAKERQAQERQRGLASGFTQYMNAQDDAGKRAALSQIAQNDTNTAYQLMNYENYGKMTEDQLWKKDEALRKEQEAKEKEKLLGQAFSDYFAATDDAGRSAAMAKSSIIDPKATLELYKKIKTQEALEKGWTTDTGRLWDIYTDPNQPEEIRRLAGMILQAKASDPNLNGPGAYQTEIGKQAAQAGVPFGNFGQVQQAQEPIYAFGSTFGEQQPMQAQPVQQIPTAAQLAADKKRAEKKAEGFEAFEKDLAQAKSRMEGYDSLVRDVEANRDILGPTNAINFKIGEWTDGLFGLGGEERRRYAAIRRQIGEIRSNLISRARAAGQVGINTAREIELATAGIDFDMTADSLIGAIEELKRQDMRLNDAIARHYGVGGEPEVQEEIIDYTDL